MTDSIRSTCEKRGVEYQCSNTPGSFRCTCRDGFEQNPLAPAKCENINECLTSTDLCSLKPYSTCHDNHGSYECKCDSGYVSDEFNGECKDIDECVDQENIHDCPENSECTNDFGMSCFFKRKLRLETLLSATFTLVTQVLSRNVQVHMPARLFTNRIEWTWRFSMWRYKRVWYKCNIWNEFMPAGWSMPHFRWWVQT